MAHFAKVVNGVVEQVIVAEQDFIDTLPDADLYIQTSYNTREGVHYDPETGEPSADQTKALRMNYAAIGGTYSKMRDAFIPPKPFPSWVFVPETCTWKAPVDMPQDGKLYMWEEMTVSWAEIK
jgi:hypothetical protein